jgi:hypothetical protein
MSLQKFPLGAPSKVKALSCLFGPLDNVLADRVKMAHFPARARFRLTVPMDVNSGVFHGCLYAFTEISRSGLP